MKKVDLQCSSPTGSLSRLGIKVMFYSYNELEKVLSFLWFENVCDDLECIHYVFGGIQLLRYLFLIFSFLFFDVDLLKSLLNLLQYSFCFMFWFFGCEACGILAPWPGIEPALPVLEGEVLTTGPPGKSPVLDIFF